MPFIRESIVTTRNADGSAHIAPMGLHELDDNALLIAPFKPSTTHDNLLRDGRAIVNYCDDVRIFAGCVTGRKDWPTLNCETSGLPRLADSLSHAVLEVDQHIDDKLRPHFICKPCAEFTHKGFYGFNRAQVAVIEAAILVTRLHMLDDKKITDELEYLTIAIDKCAGARELEAWQWLLEKIESHRSQAA